MKATSTNPSIRPKCAVITHEPSSCLIFLPVFPWLCAMASVAETKNEAIHAALKTGELAKGRRSVVVVHVMKIAVICEIDRIEAYPHFVPAPMFRERQMHMKVSVNLCVERKERGKALAIRQPCVILQHVNVGVWKAGVNVDDGTHGQRPRKMERSPADHSIRDVREEDARNIGANDGLLEWKENVGHGIQIAAGPAPNVGNIQVRVPNGLEV